MARWLQGRDDQERRKLQLLGIQVMFVNLCSPILSILMENNVHLESIPDSICGYPWDE